MKETITRAHEKTGSHRDIRAEGYPAPPSGWGEYSRTGRKLPEPLTVDAVCAEVLRARLKFPGNRHMLAALTEEVGELAQALLQGKPRDEIEKEMVARFERKWPDLPPRLAAKTCCGNDGTTWRDVPGWRVEHEKGAHGCAGGAPPHDVWPEPDGTPLSEIPAAHRIDALFGARRTS